MREIVEGIVGVSGEVAQPVHSRILCHGLEAALGVDDGLAATVGLILRKGGVAVVDGGTRPGRCQVVAPGVGRVGARVVGRGDDPAELVAAGEGPTGGGFRPGAIQVGSGLPGGMVEVQDDGREMAEDELFFHGHRRTHPPQISRSPSAPHQGLTPAWIRLSYFRRSNA